MESGSPLCRMDQRGGVGLWLTCSAWHFVSQPDWSRLAVRAIGFIAASWMRTNGNLSTRLKTCALWRVLEMEVAWLSGRVMSVPMVLPEGDWQFMIFLAAGFSTPK